MAEFRKSFNGMALCLYKHLTEGYENVFFSPFKISTALSLFLYGARSSTAREMRDALHFTGVNSNSELSHFRDQMLSVFNKASDGITLTSADALMSQKGMPILPEFREVVEKKYHALLMEVDFAKENAKAVREVNDWVNQKTNGMIEKIVESLEPSIVMVFLNAIYFKGLWKYPFEPLHTHSMLFYNRGQIDQGKEVPMMYMEEEFRYVEKETYKALELPYKNDSTVMLLLLPKEIDGFKNLENQLTFKFLLETMKYLHTYTVEVTLPKFRIEYTKTLSETLRKLGVVSAFESSADFMGINSENACISEVFTKSVLDVNEEGSEAAAVTAVTDELCCGSCNEKFEADHPFICTIYDKDKDIILFVGRLIEF